MSSGLFGVGTRRWELDYYNWEGAVDGSKTDSVARNFLTPINKRMDLQLGLGVDHSDAYGSIRFLSLRLFYFGGT